ncbi:WecB/TagA/CpsF family glycosyltransferase [Verrucomicrobiota bacterium]
MDRIILGDNQFFGINHMSQTRAAERGVRFATDEAVLKVVDTALDCGIRAFMLNTNDRVAGLCEHFRSHPSRYSDMRFYVSMPYAHKYASAVNEKGVIGAVREIVLRDNSGPQIMSMLAHGGMGLLKQDPFELMRVLIDAEMKAFRGLNVEVMFLQNIVTDLLLGYGVKEVFVQFADYIRKKYDAEPGFITLNMPMLVDILLDCGIENPIVCSAVNKIGYLMNPDIASYDTCLAEKRFRPMAMSILASGAVPPREAVDFVARKRMIQSIVFGASSRAHIEHTKALIDDIDAAAAVQSPGGTREGVPLADKDAGPDIRRIQVLGVPVDAVDEATALRCVKARLDGSGPPGYIVAINPEKVQAAATDPQLSEFIEGGLLLLPDGVGVVWALKRLQGISVERLPGADFMESLCALAQRRGSRVFVYGSSEDVNKAAVEALCARYEGLEIVGRSHGYVPEEKMEELVARINDSGAEVLFVALGSPRQEKWIEKWLPKLSVKVCQGVGGTLDTIVGKVRRAPLSWQRRGLEWLYRFIRQPQRIHRQINIWVFAMRVLREKSRSVGK